MNITEIIVALIGLLSAIITGVLVPYIRRKTTGEQQKEIAKWVSIAVFAAEQIFTETQSCSEKRDWVFDFLAEQGIPVDKDRVFAQVDALIEAFVAELNHPNASVAV